MEDPKGSGPKACSGICRPSVPMSHPPSPPVRRGSQVSHSDTPELPPDLSPCLFCHSRLILPACLSAFAACITSHQLIGAHSLVLVWLAALLFLRTCSSMGITCEWIKQQPPVAKRQQHRQSAVQLSEEGPSLTPRAHSSAATSTSRPQWVTDGALQCSPRSALLLARGLSPIHGTSCPPARSPLPQGS